MHKPKQIEFVYGVNGKPIATQLLAETLSTMNNLVGVCFFGFPVLATPEGKASIDAVLISPSLGIVLFDIVEGTQLGTYTSRQDDLANTIEAKLKLHRELVKGRQLLVPITAITFAPAINHLEENSQEGYPLANEHNLVAILRELEWPNTTENLYRAVLSAIESVTSLRKSRLKREVKRVESRGAKLKQLEDAIATLDHRQNRAVIETVDGVQRIRGLAGSGKTIVLALKAAYLHTQYPDWRIAVTFQTRSLKGQFKRLITNFCLEQSGEEPDWTKLRVINAWGAMGDKDRDGIYHEFCRTAGVTYYDFESAKQIFGNDNPFDQACQAALKAAIDPPELYDAILIDEAQDFAPSFLRLCYAIAKPPKRLVYAYDELQNLSGESLPPPEELFGSDQYGRPLVSFDGDTRRDIILQKCYRNSRPVLVTAHALGFGIYRSPAEREKTGIVQMFDIPALWEEIGYRVHDGELKKGKYVSLERTDETSPRFLEEHSSIDDLVQFQFFLTEKEQHEWLIEQIQRNLTEDELRHDDIIVIHPDPQTARQRLGPIRKRLLDLGIPNHLAGVDTDADVFYKLDTPSITFTSIYRAKGNEAGMVYIVNAQECVSSLASSALRNRLFTAITRSKAWVRVLGYGDRFRSLMDEFITLKQRNFRLEFTYPTDKELRRLRIVHRDLSPQERKRLENRKKQMYELIEALEKGDVRPEDFDEMTKERLLQLLGGNDK